MSSPATAKPGVPLPGALRLSPGDARERIRQTMWMSVVEGSFTTVFLTWTSGAVLTGYMLHLGAGPLALAAVASVPLLAQLVNPLMAWWVGRSTRRLPSIIASAALGRGLWLLAAFLPLAAIAPRYLPLALVLLVALSSLLQTGAGPAWVALMADVVPPETRGSYFGWRTGVVGVVGMLATVAAGLYLDRAAVPLGFQMILVGAVLFAVVGVYLYGLHYEPRAPAAHLTLLDTFRLPLRDPNFRRFVLFATYWQGSVMLAAPFVIPYFFAHLHMSFTQVALWSGLASVCSLFTAPLWGQVADRVGHKAVLTITSVMVAVVLPLCWMLAVPGRMGFIWVSGVMDALAWGGVNTAMFNLALASASPRHRVAYIAILGMATGLAGCLTGLLSGPLLTLFLRGEFQVAGYQWTGYHWLFVFSGLLRSQAWRLLRTVHESRAWPALEVLRDMWTRGLNRLPWKW